MGGKTETGDDSDSTTNKKQTKAAKSGNLSMNDLKGKLFTSSKYDTEFLSILAPDPGDGGNSYANTITLYNVRMTAAAYPEASITKPSFEFNGNSVTIVGHDHSLNEFDGNKLTLTRISAGKYLDTWGTTYTEFNGNANQLVDKINQEQGYPMDPIMSDDE